MKKLITLRLEHTLPTCDFFRWFWIHSVRDFTEVKNKACQDYIRNGGKKIFTQGSYKKIGGIPTHKDIEIALDTLDTPRKMQPKILFGDKQTEIAHYLCLDFKKKFYKNEAQNYIHIGFIYQKGSEIIKRREEVGFSLMLKNAQELYFDNSIVGEKYAHLSDNTKECRVFWFGSYYFGR